MKAKFEGATIKVWFKEKGISRNLIKTAEGGQYIMPMVNVNMIEEISTN